MNYYRAENLRQDDKGWRVHPNGTLEVFAYAEGCWVKSGYRNIDEVAVEMALAGEVLYRYECC